MSSCMRLLCLAEAQAVIAHRAGQRGSKPSVTSALHLGSSDLFEQVRLLAGSSHLCIAFVVVC